MKMKMKNGSHRYINRPRIQNSKYKESQYDDVFMH